MSNNKRVLTIGTNNRWLKFRLNFILSFAKKELQTLIIGGTPEVIEGKRYRKRNHSSPFNIQYFTESR